MLYSFHTGGILSTFDPGDRQATFDGVAALTVEVLNKSAIARVDETTDPERLLRGQPKFLLHDNDGKFGQFGRPIQVENAAESVSCRLAYDEWLWQEMEIRGIAIPYGTPKAAAHIERLIGTLRRECLDRMLIWNERHLRHVLTEFVTWYNQSRVRQGLSGIPDPDPALVAPKPAGGRLVAIPVLNGLHHDYRLAA